MILKDTYVLILAGGIGSRFWPLSRETKPKQFLDILGTGRSLIQACYERYARIIEEENIYVIANEKYRDLIKEHLPKISDSQILSEPFGRNTAPCVAYATHKIQDLKNEATMIVAPSDHLILNEESFYEQVKKSVEFARDNDVLITLGIKPHRPDTGYGYIQFLEDETEPGINQVKTFTEKPPLEMAEKFLESGDFLWNSGMFIWSLSSIQKALQEHLTEMDIIFKEASGAYNTKLEQKQIEKIYQQITGISIDNGLMEKADNVYVLPSDFGWSDLGTWRSVADNIDEEGDNKVIKATLRSTDSKDNLVVTDKEKLVVIKGVKGLFIIDTEDALLICPNDQEQEIKKIATGVKKEFGDKYS